MNQEHGKQALIKVTQNVATARAHEYDRKVRQPDPSTPHSALEELISTKLDAVLTSIDGEAFSGNEKELGKTY